MILRLCGFAIGTRSLEDPPAFVHTTSGGAALGMVSQQRWLRSCDVAQHGTGSPVMRLRTMPWRRVGLVALMVGMLVPNVLLLRESLGTLRAGDFYVYDWWLIQEAHERIGTGSMYVWGASAPHGSDIYLYRYSPLLPAIMAPLLDYGLQVWRLLHVAALIALPSPIAAIALLAGPFWFDVAHGNFLTFAFVAAWLALAGNRFAMGAYFTLSLLIPRPLMLPVVVWLLWREPQSRPVFLGVFSVNLLLVVLTGELLPWAVALVGGGDQIGSFYDIGPSALIGVWWLPFGLALAAWLTWKGRLGLASLAVSPYVLPYYLLMGLLEIRQFTHLPLGGEDAREGRS